jgi:methylthioribose-1-phosphate isomerase
MNCDHIGWTEEGHFRYLDQTRLPQEEKFCEARTVEDVVEAMQTLRVRGAPLIGISAAMGLTSAARNLADGAFTRDWFESAVDRIGAARPTAINLLWALERMRDAYESAARAGGDGGALIAALHQEAQDIWDEDAAMCLAIGEAGARLIPDGATVMTHCNAGALATGGIGTALAPVYELHKQKRRVQVIANETRPLRQGSRLTAWELAKAGIPVTTIVDGAAGAMMAQGKVDLVITGADRIAANGDTANKIGTYGVAVLARAHGIPFYVAAPCSTFDLAVTSGEAIPIELRSPEEIDAAPGAAGYNPAFDVTPAEYIAALITDRGIIEPPYTERISQLIPKGASSSG